MTALATAMVMHDRLIQVICCCCRSSVFPQEKPLPFLQECLEKAGLKPLKVSGGYLIDAFLSAIAPMLDFADRFMASLKGNWLTGDHTFRWPLLPLSSQPPGQAWPRCSSCMLLHARYFLRSAHAEAERKPCSQVVHIRTTWRHLWLQHSLLLVKDLTRLSSTAERCNCLTNHNCWGLRGLLFVVEWLPRSKTRRVNVNFQQSILSWTSNVRSSEAGSLRPKACLSWKAHWSA